MGAVAGRVEACSWDAGAQARRVGSELPPLNLTPGCLTQIQRRSTVTRRIGGHESLYTVVANVRLFSVTAAFALTYDFPHTFAGKTHRHRVIAYIAPGKT